MLKRRRNEEDESIPMRKKRRLRSYHDLSTLSDELILKVLTYLPISDLATCHRLSYRLQRLAGDSELWKEKYYARWVRPRAVRIPGLKDTTASSEVFRYSSKVAKWLCDDHLVQQGRQTNWKRQYRLRDNWWRGNCKVRELEVADPPAPPVLVKIHQGITFTADSKSGLRAWTTKTTSSLIASLRLSQNVDGLSTEYAATSLGIDNSALKENKVCVGFADGSFKIYLLENSQFFSRHVHPPSHSGAITAVAMFYPYLLNMSEKGMLSLYRFPSVESQSDQFPDPLLVASLKSSCVFAPLSLSIRLTANGLIASIAYSFARLSSGWCVGLQELRMTEHGEAVDSRLTCSVEGNADSFHSISHEEGTFSARLAASQPFVLHPQSMARPTGLSYSHPYLLASLPDNTLMTYLVTSNAERLEIAPGRRLWGHTSSVSGVQVSDRGKAVSVSRRGNEIRVWELEELISSSFPRRTSVCIKPQQQDLGIIADAIKRRGNGLGLALEEMPNERPSGGSWVGFDEEQVVVLGENNRRQVLSCYDFT